MPDTTTTGTASSGSTVDTTKAPAKILSITEIKNGSVFLVTEAKVYQFVDGKMRPVIFADVEHDAAMARAKLVTPGAVSAAPAPVPPPLPPDPALNTKPSNGGLLNQPPISAAAP